MRDTEERVWTVGWSSLWLSCPMLLAAGLMWALGAAEDYASSDFRAAVGLTALPLLRAVSAIGLLRGLGWPRYVLGLLSLLMLPVYVYGLGGSGGQPGPLAVSLGGLAYHAWVLSVLCRRDVAASLGGPRQEVSF